MIRVMDREETIRIMDRKEFIKKLEDISSLFYDSEGLFRLVADRIYLAMESSPTEENAKMLLGVFILGYNFGLLANHTPEYNPEGHQF